MVFPSKIELPPGGCKVLAVKHFVNDMGCPTVLSTSRHVTQGIVDLSNEKWDAATNTLSGTSRVVANDPYELRIYAPKNYIFDKADAGDATIEQTPDGQLLRLVLKLDTNCVISWSVCFRAVPDSRTQGMF